MYLANSLLFKLCFYEVKKKSYLNSVNMIGTQVPPIGIYIIKKNNVHLVVEVRLATPIIFFEL